MLNENGVNKNKEERSKKKLDLNTTGDFLPVLVVFFKEKIEKNYK